MALYKRPNSKHYWTKFYFEGRLIQRSTKCTSKKKAQEFEAALKTQLNLKRIGIEDLAFEKRKPLTFADAMSDFFRRLEVKESTLSRYEGASKAPIEFFARGQTLVESIDKNDIERFKAWRRKQHKKAPAKVLKKNPKARLKAIISPATLNRELSLLSNLFNDLIRLGSIRENPATDIKRPDEDNFQFRVVSGTEYCSYLLAASQPLQDVATVIYEQGMRPAEVIALQKDHLDFTLDKIRVVTGKTKAARRRLTMTPKTREILLTRYQSTEGPYLFSGGRRGQQKRKATGEKPVVKVNNAHNAAIERAKVRWFRLYDLRHTFATEFIQAGGDLVTLAAILGHANLAMVQRYCHPTEQHQADSMMKLRSFRNGEKNVAVIQRSA